MIFLNIINNNIKYIPLVIIKYNKLYIKPSIPYKKLKLHILKHRLINWLEKPILVNYKVSFYKIIF